jgi:signal transduction histidine kinase
MVYHDLRSPLANVVSSLDVMESLLPPQDGGALSSVLNIAVRSTGRIQRLVNSLLDITRLEAGQTLINQTSVDAHTLVLDSVDAVQSLSKSKNQCIDVELPENLPLLWADEDMIRRVIVNLLENAVKFSAVKTHIGVGAQPSGDQVEFWVQDSGPGIPRELQDKIFEKFTRLHADSSTKGLGLGLAFCRLAVQAHGGKIWLESRPKAGSRFFFTLPAAPAEQSA